MDFISNFLNFISTEIQNSVNIPYFIILLIVSEIFKSYCMKKDENGNTYFSIFSFKIYLKSKYVVAILGILLALPFYYLLTPAAEQIIKDLPVLGDEEKQRLIFNLDKSVVLKLFVTYTITTSFYELLVKNIIVRFRQFLSKPLEDSNG